MTSPEARLLRETATSMREHHPVSHPRHEMWFSLAKLIEHAAQTLESTGHTPAVEHALVVARAYQAAVPRPDIDESV